MRRRRIDRQRSLPAFEAGAVVRTKGRHPVGNRIVFTWRAEEDAIRPIIWAHLTILLQSPHPARSDLTVRRPSCGRTRRSHRRNAQRGLGP